MELVIFLNPHEPTSVILEHYFSVALHTSQTSYLCFYLFRKFKLSPYQQECYLFFSSWECSLKKHCLKVYFKHFSFVFTAWLNSTRSLSSFWPMIAFDISLLLIYDYLYLLIEIYSFQWNIWRSLSVNKSQLFTDISDLWEMSNVDLRRSS